MMLRFLTYLFYSSILLLPFYIFPSGTVQPSYLLLLLFSFGCFFFQKGKLVVRDYIYNMLPFYLYVLLNNLIYFFIYQDKSFLDYPIFLSFNFIISTCLISFLRYLNQYCNIEKFFNRIVYLIIIVLLLMFFLWFLGLGRYDPEPRYNAFFNDPNQMAFFILCVLSIVFMLTKKVYIYIFCLFLGIFLILLTISRSALVGCIPLILSVFFTIFNNKGGGKLVILKLITFISIFSLLFMPVINFLLSISYVDILVNRFLSTDFSEQSDVRGYNRLVEYSEYLLFGAGQGLDIRFNSNLEIHSTWAAFLFYYGIVGTLLFISPLVSILKSLDYKGKILFLAPMLYSFSTFGARTPIFWIFLSVFYFFAIENRKVKKVLLSD